MMPRLGKLVLALLAALALVIPTAHSRCSISFLKPGKPNAGSLTFAVTASNAAPTGIGFVVIVSGIDRSATKSEPTVGLQRVEITDASESVVPVSNGEHPMQVEWGKDS